MGEGFEGGADTGVDSGSTGTLDTSAVSDVPITESSDLGVEPFADIPAEESAPLDSSDEAELLVSEQELAELQDEVETLGIEPFEETVPVDSADEAELPVPEQEFAQPQDEVESLGIEPFEETVPVDSADEAELPVSEQDLAQPQDEAETLEMEPFEETAPADSMDEAELPVSEQEFAQQDEVEPLGIEPFVNEGSQEAVDDSAIEPADEASAEQPSDLSAIDTMILEERARGSRPLGERIGAAMLAAGAAASPFASLAAGMENRNRDGIPAMYQQYDGKLPSELPPLQDGYTYVVPAVDRPQSSPLQGAAEFLEGIHDAAGEVADSERRRQETENLNAALRGPGYGEYRKPDKSDEYGVSKVDILGGAVDSGTGTFNRIRETAVDYNVVYEGLEEYDFNGKNYAEDSGRLNTLLDGFREDDWKSMEFEGRKEQIAGLFDYVNDVLRLENPPKIEYYNEPEQGNYGGYNPGTNTLAINEYMLYDSKEAADTVAHELWHAYQHERASNPETPKDYQYQFGFDNYTRPDDDFEGYQSQLVEAEARAFADQFKGALIRTRRI